MEREDQIGRRKLSDGAEKKVIAGEEKTRMCGILFLAVALMPTRWRMFVSVTCVGEIRTSCEARSTHPCARSISCRDRRLSLAPRWIFLVFTKISSCTSAQGQGTAVLGAGQPRPAWCG